MLENPPTLNHFPGIDMKRYGLNRWGDPIYRIVWAESRKHIVQGEWADGTVGAKWRPRYRQILIEAKQQGVPGFWIMEAWLPPEQYHKMPRDRWDLLYPSMPFMDRGDYDHCFTFEACSPDNANVDKLVKWIEAGRTGSYQDNLDACNAEYAQEEKDKERIIGDRILNSIPAFGSAPMIGHGGGRGTKTASLIKSANELNLPMVGGSAHNAPVEGRHGLFAGKKRKEYSVPVKV